MEKLIMIIMILSILNGAWWLAANLRGHALIKMLIKTLGVIEILIPGVYFLKTYSLI
jgi:hypothetical protein|tara:strand:- start:3347 stop:3517 length:171 start_codon:yes stop_codon:yes gene_type:complete